MRAVIVRGGVFRLEGAGAKSVSGHTVERPVMPEACCQHEADGPPRTTWKAGSNGWQPVSNHLPDEPHRTAWFSLPV